MSEVSLPPTMFVAELHDIDDLRCVERPLPSIGPGELLVRIEASGICSGDLMPWYIRRKAPLVLGHEPVGRIVLCGEGATDRDGLPFRCGERVAIHHHAPCLRCRACRRGAYVQCATWRRTRIDPGGISGYVRVPRENCIDTLRLPDHLASCDAVLVEPLGCVVKSLRRARLHDDDLVLVMGLGVMGLLHVAALTTSIALPGMPRATDLRVVGSDFDETRRARASRLGATAVFDPTDALAGVHALSDGRGADVVICGPGTPTALQEALNALAPDGTLVMFTPIEPTQRWLFDQSEAYFRDLSLVASYSCGPEDTRLALAALAAGLVTIQDVGGEIFAPEQTAQAYDAMRRGQIVKAIVAFP